MILKKLSYFKYSLSKIVSNLLSKKSQYSQHGEDILVSNLLKQIGSFIDIGANDGVFLQTLICLPKKCFWTLH